MKLGSILNNTNLRELDKKLKDYSQLLKYRTLVYQTTLSYKRILF